MGTSPNIVEVLEAFLAGTSEVVEVALTTDGRVLRSYGVTIAIWMDNNKISVVPSESITGDSSRTIKRHIEWVTAMARRRGLLYTGEG